MLEAKISWKTYRRGGEGKWDFVKVAANFWLAVSRSEVTDGYKTGDEIGETGEVVMAGILVLETVTNRFQCDDISKMLVAVWYVEQIAKSQDMFHS